jgi:hypothetical protein
MFQIASNGGLARFDLRNQLLERNEAPILGDAEDPCPTLIDQHRSLLLRELTNSRSNSFRFDRHVQAEMRRESPISRKLRNSRERGIGRIRHRAMAVDIA